MEGWSKLFLGLILIIVGVWQLDNVYKWNKKGYRDDVGNDIAIYIASIVSILTGLFLVYKDVFG